MARLYSCGFELQSVATGVEFDSTSGSATLSIDTSVVRSGNASLKVVGAGTFGYMIEQFRALASGIVYVRFYFYVTTMPAVETTLCGLLSAASAGTQGAGVTLFTDSAIKGHIGLVNGTGVQLGANSPAVLVNNWYCLELSFDHTNGDLAVAQLNNAIFAQGIGTSTQVGWMWLGGIDADTFTINFDDVAINDATGAGQTSWPGAGSIVHLLPNAAGDNNTFSVQVGGTAGSANNYTRVSEVTPDDATSYNADTVGGDADDFNITDTPSSIRAIDNVNVVQIGVRYAALVAALESSLKVRCKKAPSGTISKSAAITPTSVSFTTNANAAPANYPLTLYQDPDSINWVKSTLDTAQIGYEISAGNTNSSAVSAVWMLVDSAPPTLTNKPENTLRYMRVGDGMSRGEIAR